MRVTNTKIMTALLTTAAAVAFETGGKWKMDGDKLALDANGNPIFVKSDGTEQSVQGDTISRLNGEARDHRLRAEKAEASLEAFKGLDPEKAKAAIDTVSKIDAKKLIDAGEVDKVKEAIKAEFTTQLTEATNKLTEANGTIDRMKLSHAFSTSEFMRDRIAVPPEMFEATFAKNFKIEDGKIVAVGPDGNPIYSKKNMGERAGFDEALEIIVDTYPHKDTILKANGGAGSGNGGNGGNRGNGRVMKRADFAGLAPAEQQAFSLSVQKGEAQLVD